MGRVERRQASDPAGKSGRKTRQKPRTSMSGSYAAESPDLRDEVSDGQTELSSEARRDSRAVSAAQEASAIDPVARHSSRIELSLSALRANVRFLREKVGNGATLSAVVKANAYGHGTDPFVPMAEQCGVNHFSVASGHEASEVLKVCSDESSIMIMGMVYPEDLPWIIENEIEFYVFDLELMKAAASVATKVGKPALVHLEAETGGNRTGLDEPRLESALKFFKENRKHFVLRGVCTHLAGIESIANQFRITKQLDRFSETQKRLRKHRLRPSYFHVGCSAAALAFPDTVMDLVRVGTAIYGLWPSPDIHNMHLLATSPKSKKKNGLQRVLTWKTDVMHIKDVERDEFVGYGTAFQAPADMRIAVIPVGYSNGLPRPLSNRGHVLIRGYKCPIVGLVNMNACIVDVSRVGDVETGEEVVLVGKQKKNVIPIRSFSDFSNELNNEFISRLPAAIPRRVVR